MNEPSVTSIDTPVLENARVFVAGHNGMVGSAIVRRLQQEDCTVLMEDRSTLDLTDQRGVSDWFQDSRPDVVFVAAARVGGILANDQNPVAFLLDNLKIQSNVIESAYASGVRKLIFLGSSCIYPREASQPISEEALLTGPLESTNEWYAIAKIAGIKLCQAYKKNFGTDFISAMPCNLYGVNDNFDLSSSHVLPALIRKAHDAKERRVPLEVWGSGKPQREFLFADDAADAVVFLAKNYSGYEHVNVGAGQDISISGLVEKICRVVGFDGEIRYDASKPDGTMKKLMAVDKLTNLGWTPKVTLDEGLGLTYEWYQANYL